MMNLTYLPPYWTLDIHLISLSFLHLSYCDCLSLTLNLPSLTLHLTVIYLSPKPETILYFDKIHDFIHNHPSSSSY